MNKSDLSVAYIELAGQFHFLGFDESAFRLAQKVLICEDHARTATARRAHNIAAACSFRRFDFEASCSHLALSYDIAQQLSDETGKYAVMANAVALLETMGSIDEAKALSRHLLSKISEPSVPMLLKYQITINGALLCRSFEDERAFQLFHQNSRKVAKLFKEAPDDWASIYDSNEIHSLVIRKQEMKAREYLRWIYATRSLDDPRVRTYIYSAEGEVNLAFGERAGLIQSRRKLRHLLQIDRVMGHCKEHVLRTLVSLYDEGSAREQKVGLAYLRTLREHLVSAKHRHFFQNLDTSSTAWANMVLRDPVDRRSSFDGAYFDGLTYLNGLKARVGFSDMTNEWYAISHELNKREGSSQRSALRSSDYFVAENWAVAAEIAAGRTGRHCFQVGRFAALIARGVGWSEDQCEKLELSCRLHDLGNVAIDRELLCLSLADRDDTSRHHREHTLAGERLLGLSSDPVLMLSSKIAAAHHEWWNGCGYPNGVAGAEIIIEARICAVADFFLRALEAHDDGQQWKVSHAVRQVISMSGVQLDPGLIGPFIGVVEKMSFRDDLISEIVDSGNPRLGRSLSQATLQ